MKVILSRKIITKFYSWYVEEELTYLFNTIQRLLIYTPTEVGTPGLCPKVSEFKTIVINMNIIAFARVRFIIYITYQENYIKKFWRQFHENGTSFFTTDK